jgi:hypothetical protein
LAQKKKQKEQPLDPKLALEFKKVERSLKKAFGAVKRDINIFYGEFARFKLLSTNQIKKLKLSDDKVSEVFNFLQSFEKLRISVDELKQNMKKFADKDQTKEELSDMNKRFLDYVEKSSYNSKIKEIDKQLEIRDVKLIDLAKVETKINSVKKNVQVLSDMDKNILKLKEDFLKFKKTALTRYNVDKQEKWIKELEKDLLQLISLRKKVDALSTVAEVENMRRILTQNVNEQKQMKTKFEKVMSMDQDFSNFKNITRDSEAEVRKELAIANNKLVQLQKSNDKLQLELKELKRIAQLEKEVKQMDKKISRLEKVKPTVVVKKEVKKEKKSRLARFKLGRSKKKKTKKTKKVKKAKKPKKTKKKKIARKSKKTKKSKKGKKGTVARRVVNWLVEEE